jgi:hypothetical protein
MDKFDSASGRAQCWAMYTDDRLAVRQVFISDYGFRIQSGPDHPGPMFDRFGWPRQAYSPDTDGLGANPRRTSVISAQCIKIRWDEQWEMHLYGAEVALPVHWPGAPERPGERPAVPPHAAILISSICHPCVF